MDKTIRKSIAFQAEDEQTVAQLMKELGIGRSAAIRLILRDWKRNNDRYSITESGRHLLNSETDK